MSEPEGRAAIRAGQSSATPLVFSPEASELIQQIVYREPELQGYVDEEPREAEALGAVRALGRPDDTEAMETRYLDTVRQADRLRLRDQRSAARNAAETRKYDVMRGEIEAAKNASGGCLVATVMLTLAMCAGVAVICA